MRSEALAQQFETKAREAATVLEVLSDAEWTQVTRSEGWTVGATAHHLAGAFEAVSGLAGGLAARQARGHFTRAMLDEMNAAHAREYARCDKAETLALFQKGAATAAAAVRGLSDDQLETRGAVFADAPPMSVQELVVGGLIKHIDEHIGSIRRTVGR